MRLLAFGVAGLLIGSFLTVVIHRVPRGGNIATGRSRCPTCGTEIRAVDNVPVLSWVLLHGRCRACGARISPVYPLLEATTAALFVGAAAAFDSLGLAIAAAAFLALMLAIAVIDARHRIVPNRLVYPAFVVFLAAIAAADLFGEEASLVRALVGMLVYGGPLLIVGLAVPGGMGMGDVKLAALIGLVLGSRGLSLVAVAAGVGILGGGVGAIVALLVLRRGRKHQMPFGPFLAIGAVAATLVGTPLTRAYLSLVGL